MDEAVFERRLDQELEKIDKILVDRNVENALKVLPGKELLQKLAPKAGCKNGTDLMRSIKRNLTIESYPIVNALAEEIKASISLQLTQENLESES